MSAYDEHQQAAAAIVARCAVVTLSDTRTQDTDASGARIRELLIGDGHTVVSHQVIRDEPELLASTLRLQVDSDEVDVVITNGGTGIGRRDSTVPVIERLLTTPLPGFGELFRMLSWQQIGSGAMLSRALGGVAARSGSSAGDGKLLFSLPGSTKAVDLAMTKLILPELRHLLRELRR
jgi:molybdenum cofactor biosynthesis protein B